MYLPRTLVLRTAVIARCNIMYVVLKYLLVGTGIGPSTASGFLVFARLIERWALGEVLALSAMAGCSQRVELCAAYALRMQGRWDM